MGHHCHCFGYVTPLEPTREHYYRELWKCVFCSETKILTVDLGRWSSVAIESNSSDQNHDEDDIEDLDIEEEDEDNV